MADKPSSIEGIEDILDMTVAELLQLVSRNYMDGKGPSITITGEPRANMPWCIAVAVTTPSVKALTHVALVSRGLEPIPREGKQPDDEPNNKEETIH